MYKATYRIVRITDHFVLIEDLDEGLSVTNDANHVVADLHRTISGDITHWRVYYRDTDGRFDELRHENGCFIGYAPCTDSQQDFLCDLL